LKEPLQDFPCPLCDTIRTGYLTQVYDSIRKEKIKPLVNLRNDTDYTLLWPSQFIEHIELGYVVLKSKIHELFLVELG
jgi:hypothetical protein